MVLQSGAQVIVQSELTDKQFECLGFTGIPVSTPAFIVLASAGTTQATVDLSDLRRELLAELHALAPNIQPVELPCHGLTPDPRSCHAQNEPDCHKILVLVGDDQRPLSLSPFHQPWLNNSPNYIVLPVYRSSAKTLIRDLLPQQYSEINTQFWSRSIAAVIPAIFARSGLTGENPRIFISYRQKDAPALAMQLFDTLSHNNFDTFLDHFRIPPGVNFQARLTQELGDKTMVLLIESEHVLDSEWTTYEINVAKACSLGVFALHVPTGVYVPGIDATVRMEASNNDFKGDTFGASAELKDEILDAVVDRVKKEHDRALFARRRILRESLEGALLEQGAVPPQLTTGGALRVQSASGVEYLVWLTPRPPELTDFHGLHGHIASPVKGVVVGLSRLMEPMRLAQTDWLASLSQIRIVDEGHLKQAAAYMAHGIL